MPALIAFAEERFGGLDVLVNNAGPYWPEPLDRWLETVQANLPGPIYAMLHAVPAMRRLTTTLGWLRERHGIRVNCLVPDWVASAEVQAYVDSLTPQQRKDGNVPDVLITLDEVAGAVARLATDESLAGRVMVWWCGQPPRLIAAGDPGYAALE